ncbi:Rab3 GTPase-activating protein catalytic subunit [Cinnamomum micranthum f. kanehirae]|uniref:Rab3 GTPase-activating protein catalytic subunit n=1 Tax=Cinnamomum micranthum f. kanehirae TaxID=337451 RepID=A0A3S3PT36_9MAGN|nr:Rab3 GTPase-activating protein catalytic subunit [Cinnamomum micranthum f. kanehirae]
MDFSSSLVSRTKTAFHSAAAKAEKVLTDIKTDFKNDREREGDSHKTLKKSADKEQFTKSKSKDKEEFMGHAFSIIIAAKSFVLLSQCRRIRMKAGPAVECSRALEDGSRASEIDSIPPSFIIKRLAIATENGKNFNSLKDLLKSARGSSPVKERSSLSFSAVKSLVLREKEEKLTRDLSDYEDITSLIRLLFNTEDPIPRRNDDSGSATLTTSSLPRDIHGAPPESFVVRLSEIIGRMKTLQKMASFWCSVVAELRRLWYEGQPVPHVPLDETPDLNYCLLHQQLQVINCCIARKRRRNIAIESLDSIVKQDNFTNEDIGVCPCNSSLSSIIYARINNGDLVLRLGAGCPAEGLTMLETGEPVYCPVTQEGPILTEDLIRETEEFVLRTGSVGAGCSQLLSDMQAFKAANPGCILEDFIRWHSPPDWTGADSCNDTKDSLDGEDTSFRRGNLWRELWETAKPLPAVRQAPLFDEDLAVESILNVFENISPSDLFRQLFVSILSSGFIVAEATVRNDIMFSELFYDCKGYVISTCKGDLCNASIDDLCQVYETVEAILVNPEEALKTMAQSEETIADERKRGFLKINLNFVGKDRQPPRKTVVKDEKRTDENHTPLLSQLLDGRSLLFARKQTRPSTLEAVAPSFPDETDWTIV